jgi:hypothetical protein
MIQDLSRMPRISVDPNIDCASGRISQACSRVLPFGKRQELAFEALKLATRVLEPFIHHVEVLKVKFWADACPQVFLHVVAVIVEPHTGEKFEVKAHTSVCVVWFEGENVPAQPRVSSRLAQLANDLNRNATELVCDRTAQAATIIHDIGVFHAHAPGLSAYKIREESAE